MAIGLISNQINENSVNNNKILNNSLDKLTSGLKINKASDNASALTISDKLRTQATGVKQGINNANSAVAMMSIADKAMSELSNILDTIKAKAIQMTTDTTSQEGRKIIKTDILKLIDSYDNIVCGTSYNQTPLLDGCATPFSFQVGDSSSDIINVDINSIKARHMGEADPYKLKNFITGFNPMPSTIPTLPEEVGLEGKSGTIRVNFKWDSNLSLELDGYVIEPSGTVIGWKSGDYFNNGLYNTTNYVDPPNLTSNGGEVDVVTSTSGSENHVWTLSNENLNGEWKVFIRNYSKNYPTNQPVQVDVKIIVNGQLTSIPVSIPITAETDYTNGLVPVTTFNVNGLTSNTITSPNQTLSCNCDDTNLVRNDDSPTLLIQAQNLMKVVDKALTQLNQQRGNVGSATNQLESSVRNHITGYTNLKNAESIIRDVDYSEESSNFTKSNIIVNAGSFIQSQVNEIDQNSVLSLLK